MKSDDKCGLSSGRLNPNKFFFGPFTGVWVFVGFEREKTGVLVSILAFSVAIMSRRH